MTATAVPMELLAGMPQGDGEPVFDEPWQAHAFAMAVSLHAQGLFTWPEWAQALAEQIAAKRPQLPVLLATGFSEHLAGIAGAHFTVVTKPYDATSLGKAISALVGRRGAEPGSE